jgi:hypothetical protein
MPTITVTYNLPDEGAEYNAARIGREACMALWNIDQRLRSLTKHGDPSPETRALAEELRQLIREECPDALEF